MFDLTSDLNTSNLPDLALLEVHRYVDDGERVPTSCASQPLNLNVNSVPFFLEQL
jgi:hypothetical protein